MYLPIQPESIAPDLASKAIQPEKRPKEGQRPTTQPFVGAAALAVLLAVPLLAVAMPVQAQVPNYRVDVISYYTQATRLLGASESGHAVGWQVDAGNIQPFIAQVGSGLELLPLPEGFLSGAALDVNSQGWVVGTVSVDGFALDNGEPALWQPSPDGSYTVTVLPRLTSALVGGQPRPISGGQATAINDRGDLLGYSRIQGFSGGPATRFSLVGAPVNLADAGLEATISDVNELGVAVGDGIRFDLDTSSVTDLGIPEPEDGQSYIFVIASAINDSNQVVAGAHRATSLPERWKTYVHDDAQGWRAHNPDVLPSVFFGPYDNNNLGDVAAAGGVRFAAEDALFGNFQDLLVAEDIHWRPGIGFIGNDRRVITLATDQNSGDQAIVQLTPVDSDGIWRNGFE